MANGKVVSVVCTVVDSSLNELQTFKKSLVTSNYLKLTTFVSEVTIALEQAPKL